MSCGETLFLLRCTPSTVISRLSTRSFLTFYYSPEYIKPWLKGCSCTSRIAWSSSRMRRLSRNCRPAYLTTRCDVLCKLCETIMSQCETFEISRAELIFALFYRRKRILLMKQAHILMQKRRNVAE